MTATECLRLLAKGVVWDLSTISVFSLVHKCNRLAKALDAFSRKLPIEYCFYQEMSLVQPK